jgi:hypothetical protein
MLYQIKLMNVVVTLFACKRPKERILIANISGISAPKSSVNLLLFLLWGPQVAL